MRRSLLIIAAMLIALGAVEGVSYWWMHPAPAGLGEPVLVYRPGTESELSVDGSQFSEKSEFPSPGLTIDTREETADNSFSSTDNGQQKTDNSPSSTHTLLPDVVAAALPSLRCSTGTAARIDRDDDVTIHVAFFEWDLSSSTSVLEAFKHLPEECMGSIGMTLAEKAPLRTYVVRDQGTEGRGQGTEDRLSGVGMERSDMDRSYSRRAPQEDRRGAGSSQLSATDNRPPTTDNASSSTLTFDHTVFRDSRGVVVHAFKGTWVSGATDLLGEGARGGMELWNQIRRNAAFKRFRPAHARVIQGAVRGIPNPDLAWQAFEKAMLRDLRFQ